MNRVFISLVVTLIALHSGYVAAREWVDVFRNDNMIVYVDTSSIKRVGNMVKVWRLADYKTSRLVKGKSYLSYLTATEYDCVGRQSRTYQSSAHANRMASGGISDIVSWCCADAPTSQWTSSAWESPPSEWEEVFGPMNDAVWKFACQKK